MVLAYKLHNGNLIKKKEDDFKIHVRYIGTYYIGGDYLGRDPNLIVSRYGIRINNDGSVDSSFNIGTGFDNTIRSGIQQSDGKILLIGNFTSYNGTNFNRIIRLNIDGSVDNTFNIGTGFNSATYAIAVQNDGKILVGGTFTSYNGSTTNHIVRLNTNGTIDNTFSIGNGFDEEVYSIVIQNDGKILIGGYFTSYNGTNSSAIVRLNTNGSIDSSLNIGTGFDSNNIYGENAYLKDIAIQSDGKIIAVGDFNSYNGTNFNRIIRLNSDGSVDNTFNIGSGFNSLVTAAKIQNDNTILVVGYFTSYNSTTSNKIISLNSNGTINNSFTVGTGFNGDLLYAVIQSDTKIIVGGSFTIYNGNINNNFIIRLNNNGTVDNTFDAGSGLNGPAFGVVIQSNNNIILGGFFDTYYGVSANRIAAISSSGIISAIDNNFNIGNGFDDDVTKIAIQNDSKIIVGGKFISYNNSSVRRLVRLNTDGSIDAGFSIGSGLAHAFAQAYVNDIGIQSDAKILVGGFFTSYNGTNSNHIIRLNNNGIIDNTFNIGTGFSSEVKGIAIQNDSKILICGGFTSYNGSGRVRLCRLNNNGTLDNSFTVGAGFNDAPEKIAIQNDGKIILIGGFNSYNLNTRNRIVRINADGSIDNTFNIGTGLNAIAHTLAMQNDKIVVGGSFTSYNNNNFNYIVRLNNDGSIDNTFTIGNGFDGPVYIVYCQSDGKILVGGNFTTYNSYDVGYFTRLNYDGTIDSSFSFDFSNIVYSINIT